MKKNPYSLTLAMLLAAGTAAQAAPTITYDWTETGSSFGNGSGTLTVDAGSDLGADSSARWFAGSGYDYSVLSITGTLDGQAVSKYPSGEKILNFTSATLPGGDLENEAISISAGANEYYIFDHNSDSPSPAQIQENFGNSGVDAGTDTFTLTPVPEPGSLALAATGGLALLGWRKRTSR